MIVLKTSHELSLMREACRISAGALKVAGEAVEPGVTTAQIDKIAHEYILKAGATPTFLNYNGFPATACISINDEIIHGIPSHRRVIKSGDIVSIDLGASINGRQRCHFRLRGHFPRGEAAVRRDQREPL